MHSFESYYNDDNNSTSWEYWDFDASEAWAADSYSEALSEPEHHEDDEPENLHYLELSLHPSLFSPDEDDYEKNNSGNCSTSYMMFVSPQDVQAGKLYHEARSSSYCEEAVEAYKKSLNRGKVTNVNQSGTAKEMKDRSKVSRPRPRRGCRAIRGFQNIYRRMTVA
mmetsp:Transcript_2827/g.5668  ORF Transcript_2827/g.5668 Transcript_2827/m.5668 type:complete len:166 (+) Transcript_2827:62-559(+)